jgi:ADP-heptose:LPS heptosyltransferase
MAQPETVVVVETGRLGDLVMVTPALATLRRRMPAVRILVVADWPLEILEHHPCVDGLVRAPVTEVPRVHLLTWVRTAAARPRWARWLREQNCRAVLICRDRDHGLWQPAALRAGVPTVVSERLLSPPGAHHSERLHRLALAAAGADDGPAPPAQVVVTEAERASASARLAALGRDPARRLVGVHIGISRLSRGERGPARKMWPAERWRELLAGLVRDRPVQVLLTGTAAEQPAVSAVAAALPAGSALDLCGRTGVRQLAAAIAACDLFLTADTGPMHVAAALDVPLVALFSVTDPAEVGPRGPSGRHTVVESSAPCRPCARRVRKRCRDSFCTDDLTAARVRAVADAWLARIGGGRRCGR